jgi:hypothetical protein
MAIDYSGFPEHLRKPQPRVLVKKAKATAKLSAEKSVKAAIKQRDPFCVVCLFRKGADCHEMFTFRSRGGSVSLENSARVCAPATGGLCHQLLQTHVIHPEMLTERGCNGPLRFAMNRSAAQAVFGRRPIPKHITITDADVTVEKGTRTA